jgi:hypothetical protein
MSRSFFRKLGIAALVMVLFCLAGYIALGWAVWARLRWVERLLGEEKSQRLWHAYDTAMATLFPGDSDGDGVCDGREIFWHSDPRDPMKHPVMYGRWSSDGFSGDVRELLGDGAIPFQSFERTLWVSSNEPLRARGYVMADYYEKFDFPAGFYLRLTPPAGYLLAAPGGKLAATALVVPVAHDGSIAFDLQASADVANVPNVPAMLQINNAATGESLMGELRVAHRWDDPSIAPTVTIQRDDPVRPIDATYHLEWHSGSTAEVSLIEAARDQAGAPWQQIGYVRFPEASCTFHQYRNDPTQPRSTLRGLPLTYSGPLKFRIIPLRFAPPQ